MFKQSTLVASDGASTCDSSLIRVHEEQDVDGPLDLGLGISQGEVLTEQPSSKLQQVIHLLPLTLQRLDIENTVRLLKVWSVVGNRLLNGIPYVYSWKRD